MLEGSSRHTSSVGPWGRRQWRDERGHQRAQRRLRFEHLLHAEAGKGSDEATESRSALRPVLIKISFVGRAMLEPI